ncbi:MAG: phosphatidate cytidylyltransferase, partial [Spirochaetales bacterium]|nr:phosphatidate cytidylyltransferase [Spirochaetales bacterium]
AVDTVSLTILKVTRNALYMLYPGALSSAIVIILAAREFSGSLLIWFALIVFGNDSFAWLAGVTLGRKRGIFTVSPNKSLEGLIAGMAGSIGFAMAGPILFPEAIPPRWLALAILGVAVGIAVVSGDLFESALKRSAGVKDSGSIIPGRGGVLDSYDSLLFAAPVFCGIAVMMGLLS